MNVSVSDDVQLKKSENAWKPGMKREGPAEDPEMQKTQVRPHVNADVCTKTHEEELSIQQALHVATRHVFILTTDRRAAALRTF